ncbi:hypothetical protein C5S31_02335 [ANME-1 cluster archaeon GoMg2]|nr:hypothetical protein [ANME-1 cluster archaeon GoMg2]
MSEAIECVYEDGVFKLSEKINQKENARVLVTITESVMGKTFCSLKVSEDEIKEAFEALEYEWDFY